MTSQVRIPIIAIIGLSKSGKTTMIEYLISNLTKEEFKIGTIKHVHNPRHSIDVKSKDSWRHSRAGAEIVVCTSPEELAIFKKRKRHKENIDEILNLFRQEDLDLLLIEGFRSQVNHRRDIPKILVVKTEDELNNALKETGGPILAVLGPSALREKLRGDVVVPFFDLEKEKTQVCKLIKKILS
jgi:molybdopterin-guanine dinucleotide biosynthesis protein B